MSWCEGVRSPTCEACGESPSITAASIAAYDYPAFTGQPAHDAPPAVALLPQEERVTAAVLMERLAGGLRQGTQPPGGSGATPAPRPLTLLDVRPAEEFDMCHLPGWHHTPPASLSDTQQSDMCHLPGWHCLVS
jgi:adenylyltransferase/sulfurtransferase